MTNVFLDANIYLGFVKASQDKFEYLNKFLEIVKSGDKIKLVFPKITQDEVFRKIPQLKKEYLIELKNAQPGLPPLPSSMTTETNEIKKMHGEYIKKLNSLAEEYPKSVEKMVEDIIKPLISHSQQLEERNEVFNLATKRKQKGNPPGKGNHIGDELAWELILDNIDPKNSDEMIIVDGDGDWADVSSPKEAKINPFLYKEWRLKTSSEIVLFDTLGSFMKERFKDKVKDEDIKKEKEALKQLGTSLHVLGIPANIPTYQGGSYPSVINANSINWMPPLNEGAAVYNGSPNFIQCPYCHQQISTNYGLNRIQNCPYCGFRFN